MIGEEHWRKPTVGLLLSLLFTFLFLGFVHDNHDCGGVGFDARDGSLLLDGRGHLPD